MTKDCNPCDRKGSRNVLCRYYSSCLDYAILKDWLHWTCRVCRYREDKGAMPSLMQGGADTFESHDLSPEFYQQINT